MKSSEWKEHSVHAAVKAFRCLETLDLHGQDYDLLLRRGFKGFESYSESELRDKLQGWYQETTHVLKDLRQQSMSSEDFETLQALAEELEELELKWTMHGEHEVSVGNVGMLYRGMEAVEAQKAYALACANSASLQGRAGGELVTWLQEDKAREQYEPTLEQRFKQHWTAMGAEVHARGGKLDDPEVLKALRATHAPRLAWERFTTGWGEADSVKIDGDELKKLKADFHEWSGGFKPFDENHITVYVDYALADQDDRDRVSEMLMDWFNSDED